MNSDEHEERLYKGLLGLDVLHPALKGLNFLITVSIGIALAFQSWYYELYSNSAIYQFKPFAWPLFFLFAWPTCAVILWLRLTGLKWRWGILAAILVLVIYFFLSAVLHTIGMMMS